MDARLVLHRGSPVAVDLDAFTSHPDVIRLQISSTGKAVEIIGTMPQMVLIHQRLGELIREDDPLSEITAGGKRDGTTDFI